MNGIALAILIVLAVVVIVPLLIGIFGAIAGCIISSRISQSEERRGIWR